jgi:hypothetical protein
MFTIGLTLLGVFWRRARLQRRRSGAGARDNPLCLPGGFFYKRRIFEVLLDVVLIVLAYWSAYAIKFEPFSNSPA